MPQEYPFNALMHMQVSSVYGVDCGVMTWIGRDVGVAISHCTSTVRLSYRFRCRHIVGFARSASSNCIKEAPCLRCEQHFISIQTVQHKMPKVVPRTLLTVHVAAVQSSVPVALVHALHNVLLV